MDIDLKATLRGKDNKGHMTIGVYNEMTKYDRKPIYYVTIGVKEEGGAVATIDIPLDQFSGLDSLLYEIERASKS